MKLFFSLFSKSNDEEDDKEKAKKQRPRNARRVVAGTAIMLLMVMSIYAQPAAAFGFSSITHMVSGTVNKVKKTVEGMGAGAVVGAAIGAVVGSIVPGAGTVVGAEVGAALGAAIGGYLGYRSSSSSSSSGKDDDSVIIYNQQNATTEDVLNDKDVVSGTAKVLDDTQQAAYKQIAELNAVLRSDLTEYDISETGATGDLWAKIYAPQKVYGFSAFPVQVEVFTKKSNIPFSYVHLRSVKVYIKEQNSSIPLWTRTWDYGDGSEGLNGQNVVYSTVLKVPDPYQYSVKQMIDTGQVNKDLIMELFNNATTKHWEIFVDIDAYREEWQNDPQYTDQSSCEAQPNHKWDANTSTCYAKIMDKDIDYHIETTSAWMHVTMARDIGLLTQGMYASLPIRFAKTNLASKWTLYQEKFVGSVSNFITLTYAAPVHVMGSTADYKFYIAPNPGYFKPLNITMTDDFRFFTVRVRDGGSWELADSVFGHLGDLTETGVPKDLNAHYTTGTDVLTYEVFGIAYFTITRKDGQQIPIWEIVWPKVSVEPNERQVLDDPQVQQLVTIVNQSTLTADDLAQLKASVNALINGLNEKLQTAKALEEQAHGVGNSDAESYAKKAESAYQAAIDALNHAASSKDKQQILNYLNAAKKYEQAGDFYISASKKAMYGAPEQAKLDAKMGDHISNIAEQYQPHISVFGTAKNALSKKILGIPLWMILVILFALAGAFVIWKKLL
ncbi:DUF6861 domain-containing protein [Thermococcus sp. Bubb.Bath]|uniref:DUF6861 domain-containing protein n=1 Tax=Thermococcus sp. Bubb.Bath TaxID=1638242 RepID=UPI00143BBCD4|nr:glycine zipper domain-containing protein [Thermococcus sp. Bubb.Bath]NJF24549.1 glycine zipper family protein [Thermococcus sp. Bubb.Bath]